MTETVVKRIKEHKVEGKRLGRHVLHDPRSRDYPAKTATTIVDTWHKAQQPPLPLDQGNRGSCTAQALCGSLDAAPDFSGHLRTEADANAYYDQEIVLEGGDPTKDDPGGTGVNICKVAKADGLITSYKHTFSFNTALKALVLRPVMIGCNWYDSFDEPDSTGTVHISPDAQVRGGHEFVAVGISTERQALVCWNSWGPTWGPWGGRFWLPYADFERLLSEQGDVTVAIP